MIDSIRVKFKDEQAKEKYIQFLDRHYREYEAKKKKLQMIPNIARAIPVLGLIGLGIHGIKKGWIGRHAQAFVGAAIATGPMTEVFGSFGRSLVTNKLQALEDEYKKKALKKARELGGEVEIPTGVIKVK